MPAQLLEFALNHPLLCGAFTALLLLLIVTELRRGGKSLSSRELTALVNADEGRRDGWRTTGRCRRQNGYRGRRLQGLDRNR